MCRVRSVAVLAMFVALMVAPAVSRAQPQSVTLCDDIYYGGACFEASADSSFVGWDWNDRVSSVAVPAGWTVTLYEHDNFNGASLVLPRMNNPDLRGFGGPGGDGTWNDAIGSFRVQQAQAPAPTSLTFLINGIESNGEWALPGTDFSNAIAATYGAVPEFWFWSDNSWQQVLPPAYSGILSGAQQLANFLHSLPPGDVNLIAHSHGGNVVLLSQIWSTRPIRRYITMATPVNWDWYDWRFALNYGVAGRCQASSTADWVQLWGASPYQVGNFVYNVYQSVQGAIQAFEALRDGDYESSFWWFGQSVFDAIQADYWLDTTRYEVEGYTHMFVSLGHSELHTPGAWNALPAFCR